jgi:hypothetical protein
VTTTPGFTNPDPVAHDGVFFRLLEGESAGDLIHFIRSGGKGPPPVDFAKPLGGPGVIGARWTSWFRMPSLTSGHYVLGCFLPDPSGHLHVADGMAAGFVVH